VACSRIAFTFTFTFHLQKNCSLAMPTEVTGVQEQYKVNGKAGKAFGEEGIQKLTVKIAFHAE
jgi:hypothetical protein